MQKNPRTHTPLWIIGIATVSLAVIALLLRRSGISPPAPPPATSSPLIIDVEVLPTIATSPVIIPPTHALTPTVAPSALPIASSTGSEKILFVSNRDGNEEIYVMDFDGSNPTRLTQNPGRDIDPQWSPDGTKIAFLSDRENETGLYLMDIDGNQQKLLTSSVVFDGGGFSWSPDSTRLAYSALIDGYSDILVIQVNGVIERNLTATGTQEELSPSWSPDGTKIAFYRTYQHEYFIMNPDGSDQIEVVDSLNHTWSQPQWFPDGLQLLVSASDEIFSVNKNAEAVIQLTDNQNYDAFPAASPDGMEIAIVSSRAEGSEEIFIMRANGEQVDQITNIYDTRANISTLLWSPDGSRIIFTIGNHDGGTTPEVFSIDINTRETKNLSQDRSSSNTVSDIAP